MNIIDGKITECSEEELFRYWLTRWSDFYSYPEYYRKVAAAGVEIRRVEVEERCGSDHRGNRQHDGPEA
jgi:hypothetical protein